MSNKRDQSLDIAKGILIICIVLGHTRFSYIEILYWFHVPGFFIVSGLLYKAKKQLNIRKLASTLFIPLAVFASIDIATQLIVNARLRDFSSVLELIGDHALSGKYVAGVFWFIPVFFLTKIVFDRLYGRLGERTGWLVVAGFVGVHLTSDYFVPATSSLIDLQYGEAVRVPWNVDVVPFTSLYFYAGHMLKMYYAKIHTLRFFIVSGIVCSILIILAVTGGIEYILATKYSHYKSILYSATLPVIFTLFILSLSWLITKVSLLARPLTSIGQKSLIIMFLHVPINLRLFDLSKEPLLAVIIGVGVPFVFAIVASRYELSRKLFFGRA